jgi:membrane protein YqaA with SNARE-associated domain
MAQPDHGPAGDARRRWGIVPTISASRLRATRRVAALAVVVAITAVIFLLRDQLFLLRDMGYAGAFLAGLISSATIILPVPGVVITFALGGALASPLLVGLAAGLGETLGELTGYMAGYSGRAVVEDRVIYERMAAQIRRYGPLLFFVLAAIPNPTFDVAGITAGGVRYPVGLFLIACWPGKTLKALIIAYAGAGLLPGLSQWITRLF